ncbi:iron ABC transporter permease [Vineibacter terrae]|uniref:FecCD family ABC transporter permease n=1 Tax=Vineibacter terrae TaxID=2586908 RepID=UPI002E343656|nr:iron ABC transporter permease [Vineibacter terrae]HEX2890898.1 iron ABC transporter permease [Vineibacter terrae]
MTVAVLKAGGGARRPGVVPVLLALAALAAVAGLVGLALGPLRIGLADMLAAVAYRLGLANAGVAPQEEAVLFAIRLPRVLLSLAVGAALAASGAAMQGLFRNPLADPGLVGVSSGAALAAVATIVLGDKVLHLLDAAARPWALPATAFVGGLAATALVRRFGLRDGRASVATILLAGVAINALCAAGIGFLTFVADEQQLRSLVFWTMGSLGAATWTALPLALPLIVIPTILIMRATRALDAFALGEREAAHLGVDVERLKRRLLILVALATSASVSVCGIIGFVGLVVPHLLRLMCGPGHRLVLPGAALLGAALLTAADLAARLAVAPAELPIGVVTALVGGPFFLWLLVRRLRLADS